MRAKGLPQRSIKDTHPLLAKNFSDLNERPAEAFTFGSQVTVLWDCPFENHTFPRKVAKYTSGFNTCPYCSGRRTLRGFNDLSVRAPHLREEWCAQNGIFEHHRDTDPKIVVWRCNKNHEWRAPIFSRAVKGLGCRLCSSQRGGSLDETHPALMAEWDFESNATSPSTITAGSSRLFLWRCPRGHSFSMAPKDRTSPRLGGCYYCSGHRVLAGFNDLYTIKKGFVDKYWDFERNEASPTSLTHGSKRPIYLRCKRCSTRWKGMPKDLQSERCRLCEGHTSFLESKVAAHLREVYAGEILRRKRPLKDAQGRHLELDFWLPEAGVAFEVQDFATHSLLRDDEFCEIMKANKKFKGGPRTHEAKRSLALAMNIILIDLWENDVRSGAFRDVIAKSLRIKPQASKDRIISPGYSRATLGKTYSVSSESESLKRDTPFDATCPRGHKFSTAWRLLMGRKEPCDYCCGRKALKGFNDIATYDVEKLYDVTNALSPEDICATNTTTKVAWRHNDHTFMSTPASVLVHNHGCNKCSGSSKVPKEQRLSSHAVAILYPEVAQEWSGKNLNTAYETIGTSKGERYYLTCPFCGKDYLISLGVRLKNGGKHRGCSSFEDLP